jgi:uncharacterized protein (TIGR02001 family)
MPAKILTSLAMSSLLALMTSCAATAAEQLPAAEPAKPYTLASHVDLVSAYYLRGATTTYGNSYPGLGNAGADAPESSKPVLQWGTDFTHESGWYAGYWGSQINYSYKRLGESYDDRTIVSGFQDNKSIENDLYGGYTAKVGEVNYTLGLTGYLYINGKHADGMETKLGVGYRGFGLNAQTLLNDTVWGNKGDTYWTLIYTTTLPHDLSFNANLGWYTYNKEGKYLGSSDTLGNTACGAGYAFVVNGCYAGNQPVSNGFRHGILGLSQPIGKSGLTWSLQGIIGGKNRFGIHQSNKGVGSVSYAF